MKLIIAGSRDIDDYEYLLEAIEACPFDTIDEIISGAAGGVDRLGEIWSENFLDKPATKFPAKWNDIKVKGAFVKKNLYGREYNAYAGFLRNMEMVAYGDALLAVWNGKSKGTADIIKKMRNAGKPVYVYNLSSV